MCQIVETTFLCGHVVPFFIPCAERRATNDLTFCPTTPDGRETVLYDRQLCLCFECIVANDPELQLREMPRSIPQVFWEQAIRFTTCGHTTVPVTTEREVELSLMDEDAFWEGRLHDDEFVLYEDFEGLCWDCFLHAHLEDLEHGLDLGRGVEPGTVLDQSVFDDLGFGVNGDFTMANGLGQASRHDGNVHAPHDRTDAGVADGDDDSDTLDGDDDHEDDNCQESRRVAPDNLDCSGR